MAVIVGGVAKMAVNYLTPLTAANEFVGTPFVDSLPRTLNIYVRVFEVPCRSVRTQVVLCVVPFVGNNSLWKKNYRK
jgi:hypothetical protein